MAKKIRKIVKKSPRQRVGGGIKIERANPVGKLKEIRDNKKGNRISDGVKKTKIRVIGIGGGGCSIISEIASRIKKASFVAANTDLQALKATSRKVIRFQFGQNFTQGLGTGMNAELGREASLNEKEKIKKLLEGQDFCIIVACLGGGTSSGAAPIFAKISRDLGNITYGIFTLPFKFEGEKKMAIAQNSLEELKLKLNAISVIPNERIFQIIDKKTPLREALSAINKNLAESLEGLIEMVYQPGLINIDFADLKTILEGRGRLAYLNTAEAFRKEGSTEEILKKALACPLYPYSIRGAKGVLFNIAGEKNLGLGEVSQISKTISELINKEAKIIFGISQGKSRAFPRKARGEKYQDFIKITLLATGCGTKIFAGEPKRKQLKKKIIKKVPLAGEAKDSSLLVRATAKDEKEVLPIPLRQPSKSKKELKVKTIKKSKEPTASPQPESKKVKIEVSDGRMSSKESKKKLDSQPEAEEDKSSFLSFANPRAVEVKKEATPAVPEGKTEGKIRKNALQIKREIEEAEKEIEAQEKIWEAPAFLRRKTKI